MALPFFNWSRTAASNANADSTVNWAEGQAPSSVNDSARAMMASTAAYRDDVAGAISTGGTSAAYTLTSYQIFDTLAHLNGQMIAFAPNATNANTVGTDITLNVDGLGAKPIRAQPSVSLPNNSLILGTTYVATYNNSDGVFYLHNMTPPYSIPLGAVIDYCGAGSPNFAMGIPNGQALSRTTYATLFSLISTTYGTGDGSTTFNLPDITGRTIYMKEASATRLTTGTVGIDGGTLGAVGGGTQTLVNANLPAYTPSGTVTNGAVLATNVTFSATANGGQNAFVTSTTGTAGGNLQSALNLTQQTTTFTGSAQGGVSTPIKMAASGIILNKLMRII